MKKIKFLLVSLFLILPLGVSAQCPYPRIDYSGEHFDIYSMVNVPIIWDDDGCPDGDAEYIFEDIIPFDGVPTPEALENATVRWVPVYGWKFDKALPDTFPVVPMEGTGFPGYYAWVNDAITGEKKMLFHSCAIWFDYTVFVYPSGTGEPAFFSGVSQSSMGIIGY